MPLHEMGTEELDRFLSEQRVVRVCFNAFDHLYLILIPLNFVWAEGNLYGNATVGRKTAMGQANPQVAFQIDNYAHATGPWVWRSVAGQGTFEVIGEPHEIARLEAMLQARFSDAPAWFRREKEAEVESRGLVFWRIHPTEMVGRERAPGE
jgi:nitroimidazol reductase NimA-like FMN-containing flavoprotein (pyridoxamine 5'-phosphate oxidase superfamily)